MGRTNALKEETAEYGVVVLQKLIFFNRTRSLLVVIINAREEDNKDTAFLM